METRKVTIINNKHQNQTVIENSRATTLGELKAEMREKSINYEGMTFFEGHMRAELKDDAAPLPTNIPYKGEVVNDLIFLLTSPEKKIKSGAMSRNELIAEAKRLGYPSNPTQAKSAALIEFIESKSMSATKVVKEAVTEAAPKAVKKEATVAPVEAPKAPADNLKKAFVQLLDTLTDNNALESWEKDEILNTLQDEDSKVEMPDSEKKLSQKEVDDMFDFVR